MEEQHASRIEPTARLMLLGTFHFRDAGLDRYQPQYHIDVLSAERQAEVADIVARLTRYRPTKVAIERRPDRQSEIDAEYAAYQQDAFTLPPDEQYQLGFRLARQLGHPTVYGVDASGRYYAPPLDLEQHAAGRTTRELSELLATQFDFDPQRDLAAFAAQHGQTALLNEWWPRFEREAAAGDIRKTQQPLRDTLLAANSEVSIHASHRPYLVDWFKIGAGSEYPGIDWVTAWYSRNLRIFANLQRITERTDERLLLIIGAGHLPILRHCAQCSPEYRLVEVADYLGDVVIDTEVEE